MLKATPPPAPPAPASAADPATALMRAESLATTDTDAAAKTIAEVISAVTVLAIALIDSAPAPETAMPPASPPALAQPKPTENESTAALLSAATDTAPDAEMLAPPSTEAVIVEAIPFIAMEFAIAPLMPPPAPPAPEAASEPASALIVEASLAQTSSAGRVSALHGFAATAPAPTCTVPPLIVASVVPRIRLKEKAPARPPATPPPSPPARLIVPITENVSIVGELSAETLRLATGSVASPTFELSMSARTVLRMSLTAIEPPAPIPTPPPVPPAAARTTPPASAVMSDVSAACTSTLPPVRITLSLISASVVLPMLLNEAEPPPANERPPPSPPASAPPTPIVSASIVALVVASTVTLPSASTAVGSIEARTVSVISLIAAAAPTSTAVPPVVPPAKPRAIPPASALIVGESEAMTATSPVTSTSALPSMRASTVSAIVFLEIAPAPAISRPPVLPAEAPRPPAIVTALIVELSDAATSTFVASTSAAPSMRARTWLPTSLDATETPIEIDGGPRAKTIETPP